MAAKLPNEEGIERAAAILAAYQRDILLFIFDMWGLVPQPAKPAYAARWNAVINCDPEDWLALKETVTAEWFGTCTDTASGLWEWYGFEKGKHLTWQQTLIFLGVRKAIARPDILPRLFSVSSGHGIGKSASIAMFILWFLYCFYQSQVPVTAPTAHQMHDVLWKELDIWIKKMPKEDGDLFEWTADYVRVSYEPTSWFARARTSTKENTEAIAGVHADHVAIAVDEASGVPHKVFETAEGALTSPNTWLLMISNPTQIIGYFYDSHHKNKLDFQTFIFNGEESPIVDRGFVLMKLKAARGNRDDDKYKIRVRGLFPGEGMSDDAGYILLIPPSRINVILHMDGWPWIGRCILAVDPAGEGKDTTEFVLRNRFRIERILSLPTANDRIIAEYILTFIDKYNLAAKDIVVGNFGKGADVGKEVALSSKGKYEIYTVMEGNSPKEEEKYNMQFFERHDDEVENPGAVRADWDDIYLNIRALMYFRLAQWILDGGQVVDNSVDDGEFKNELSVIKYKRSLQGNKIQLMSKVEMAKLGIQSPNVADAGALSMLRDLDTVILTPEEIERRDMLESESESSDDKFNAL